MKPVPGQILPEAKFSKVRVEFDCDCGNRVLVLWTSFASGKSETCGKCKAVRWKKEGISSYGKLQLLTPLSEISKMTDLVLWRCDCGNLKKIKLTSVVSQQIRSCGCIRRSSKKVPEPRPVIDRLEWIRRIPELVHEGLPEAWTSGTNRKFWFTCRCGKSYVRKFNRYETGKSTCGDCHKQTLKNGDEFGRLRYEGPDVQVDFKTIRKACFSCSCGRTVQAKIGSVTSGKKTRCGKCGLVEETRFGSLTLKKGQQQFSKGSDRKARFDCDCGNEHEAAFHSVASGNVRSCGRCTDDVKEWYSKNADSLKHAKFPISKDDPMISYLRPSGDIRGPDEKILIECPVCKSAHESRYRYVRIGEGITCGCRSGQTSLAQHEIAAFFKSRGIEAVVEHSINGMRYDVFVPSVNLLIEYHGLKWHSVPEAKRRDLAKWKNAADSGFGLVCLFEDEWKYGRKKVLGLLQNRVGSADSRSVRPSSCDLFRIPTSEADAFYEKFHYIGKCRSSINLAAVLEDRMVACMSFKRPTRQSSHLWELVRMAADPEFRVHGIWSKLLKKFVSDENPSSIVSFSDNRLFSGGVYGKIGFSYDGDVPPDYYWCKGKRRYHKSGLRKRRAERKTGTTERELRESQGYRKIWDLGKKRWVWRP